MNRYDDAFGQVDKKLNQTLGADKTERLRSLLSDQKKVDQITSKMNQKQKSMLEYVLQNPDALQALISSPQAAEFLKKIAEGNFNG